MIKFGFSLHLYLFVLIPVVALFQYWVFGRKTRDLQRFVGTVLAGKLAPATSRRRRIMKAVLICSGLAMLLLAFARPQFGTRVETVKREGQDIIIALDLSLSMLAEDIRPNRLANAKREIANLIGLLKGDRVGLVAFAGAAFVQCPLTLDYQAAKLFLAAMDPDLIPVPGTALGEAMERAMGAFSKGDNKNKVLIIISDGEDHDGRVEEVAAKAAQQGIVAYTIGFGTPQGVPIPVGSSGSGTGFKTDKEGTVVLTKLNEGPLRSIADITGGEYYRAANGGNELNRIYSRISGMEKKELSQRQVTLFDEKYQGIGLLGLILITFEFLLPEVRRAPQEWKGRFE